MARRWTCLRPSETTLGAVHALHCQETIKHMCLGIPGQVIEITDPARNLASVDVGGVRREVNMDCVVEESHPLEKCIGDWVLVHVGFAMSRISEDEANSTLKVLKELGEMQAELEAMKQSGLAARGS